jgi:hypothetical protein
MGKCLAVVATVVLAGCQATVAPLTDAERTEIVDTMTRLAASIDQKVDRATCEAKLAVFSGQEPVVAAIGRVFRTTEDLKSMCPGGIEAPSRFDIEGTEAHVLSRDHGYIVRWGILTFEPVDGPQTRHRYTSTDIFVRTGQEWKIAHHAESGQAMKDQ